TITLIDAALTAVSKSRGEMGAAATRLQSVYSNLGNVNNNTQIAKGRIMDTDYASESASMTSKQMLMQAGTSMLKQSGSMSQLAMSLLQ
ncbi:flagellin, partial [Craterilacuibacter sp.]|uniref:flagellin n=1 Tax=Craterilacuibacter sp. TaxID=2870909 RepID=UPI003F3D7735